MAQHPQGIFDFTQAPNIPATELQVGDFSSAQLSPEIQQLVQQSFAGPRQAAGLDLRRQAESLAARRGLELFDTPVGDPFLRASAQQGLQFGSAEAQTSLRLLDQLRNFKQRQAESREGAQFGRAGLFQQSLEQRSRQFESGRQFSSELEFSQRQFNELLRDQATQNQLALTRIASNLTTGLASANRGTSSLNINTGGLLSGLTGGFKLLSKGLGGG